ncbi:L-lysine 6-transaminase [Mucilaginibacter polytrichastri]|uniref:L-lysine-epsilon aminotransferase n=1 Tax=Mucilaginibacter polytrichastri TaxID=1302689 RepID=A0A1Q5ZU47_9SPHI|nr:L-lysine 6-transaminase [Mucilaginibacter polytrichastri]OKS85295.1 putative L-lysine-epsilon aminotransferase [Mucilaginibacter polytrichastri]SFS41213.1 L-lysine 6-transaminase precursor [Mucilaginibacter polytrichastri]
MENTLITPQNVQATLSKHILADGFDLTFDMEKSKGVYIYDSKYNRTLLDFFTCFASVPLGYNHPKMINDEAFKKDLLLAALTNPSNSDIYTEQYARFLDTFARVGIPAYLPHAFFISGGGLAIENALKTAMDWKVQKNFAKGHQTEKGFKVIHFEQAFHGRTGYTMSLTNTQPVKTRGFAKFDWPRISIPYIHFDEFRDNPEELYEREAQSIAQIEKAFQDNQDDICAIIIEPIQSEGGDNHVRQEFLEQLRKLADEYEAMLIYDEVQTGVGLTGKFWSHEHFGENARPDIIAFGKKMQVCGILASRRVDENPDNVFTVSSRINSTWGGNLTDMVRATKILQIIEEDNLCTQAAETGQYLQDQLTQLSYTTDLISNIRGKGLLTAFDFPDSDTRNKFINMGLENNTMFLGCGDKSIRFRPALIMDKGHIDDGIKTSSHLLKRL